MTSSVPDVSGNDISSPQFREGSMKRLFGQLREDLSVLDRVLAVNPDLETLVWALQELDYVRKTLGQVVDNAHAAAYKALGADKKRETALGEVERFISASVKWDDEAIFQQLAKKLPVAVDPETGQTTIDGVTAIKWLREMAQVAYWRVGALKAHDIDPDQVRERTWGTKRVRYGRRKA